MHGVGERTVPNFSNPNIEHFQREAKHALNIRKVKDAISHSMSVSLFQYDRAF